MKSTKGFIELVILLLLFMLGLAVFVFITEHKDIILKVLKWTAILSVVGGAVGSTFYFLIKKLIFFVKNFSFYRKKFFASKLKHAPKYINDEDLKIQAIAKNTLQN